MTEKDLFREIGMIDEKYVEEASAVKQNKILTPAFRRTLATAACLCICLGIYFSVQSVRNGQSTTNSGRDYSENEAADGWVMDETASAEGNDSIGITNGFFEDMFDGSIETEADTSWDTQKDSASAESAVTGESVPLENETEEMDDFVFSKTLSAIEELAEYPGDYEMLCNGDAFVVTHGTVSAGMDKWELFMSGIEQGKEIQVDVIRFTEEGDAIITRVWYEDGVFCLVEDSTRDTWGKGTYTEYEFSCLNEIKNSEGYVEIIFADQNIIDPAAVNSDEVPMYYLVQYREVY